MTLFYVNGNPTQKAEDWRLALQDPQSHWKPEFSAWTLAHSWEAAHGFPPEIQLVLTPDFSDIEMIRGWVEHAVPMPGIGQASRNDLFVLAKAASENLCIAVEGKVNESLGPTISRWRDGSPNKEKRLRGILELIGLGDDLPGTIRYQLLHRLASPVIESQRFGARHAIMIIHSFSNLDKSFSDFAALLALYGIADAKPDHLYPLKTIDGLRLYAGWVRGDGRFLSQLAEEE